jgi:NADH-quinone oxidoreductase subunit C
MNEQKFISELQSQFNGELVEFAGETSFVIEAADILPITKKINEMGFERLSDITAVDYLPAEPRFHLVYQFTSIKNQATLTVRAKLSGLNPAVETVEGVYPAANWKEREIYDMFGVDFKNHSDLRRLLMPADWEGHPLRKDYPLGYEEPQYSFNFDEIGARKPAPKE